MADEITGALFMYTVRRRTTTRPPLTVRALPSIHVSNTDYKAKHDAEDSGDGSSSSTDGFKPEPTDGYADDKKF